MIEREKPIKEIPTKFSYPVIQNLANISEIRKIKKNNQGKNNNKLKPEEGILLSNKQTSKTTNDIQPSQNKKSNPLEHNPSNLELIPAILNSEANPVSMKIW